MGSKGACDRIAGSEGFTGQMGIMDTSEEYVKMCRAANKIQDIKPDDADKILTGIGIGQIVQSYEGVLYHIDIEDGDLKELVWVPRIHELSLLFRDINIPSVSDIASMLISIAFNHNEKSHQQFVLKMYMYMKYKKEWNGSEWVQA